MPYKKNWSGYLYKKISKDKKVSGYYNLSYCGGGIDIIINNVYKYCDIYGTPNAIFLLLPAVERRNYWHKNDYFSIFGTLDDYYSLYNGEENATYYTYNQIKNFEYFCKKLNIFLKWSTWEKRDMDSFKKLDFENYVDMDFSHIINSATNYEESTNKYYMISRDNAHPGIAYSDGVSNIFLKEFNEKYIF